MRIFRRPTSHPGGELRYGVRTREGRVVEFVVQLFGWVDGEWRLVAQFDHNPPMEQGHDVRAEGVHMVVFGPHGKRGVEVERHPGPLNPASGIDYAINYFTGHGERLIERYRGWQNE